MPDYQQGKIYKIECLTTGKIYIGSTTQRLSSRLSGHVADYKRFLDGKHMFVSSFDIIENGNYQITLLKLCPCSCHDELLMEERKFINELNCVNRYKRPKITDEELKETHRKANKKYSEKNREQKAIKSKIYYDNNPDKIREKCEKYRESHAEEIKEKAHLHYLRTNGANQKKYYETHKSEIMARKREKRRLKNLFLNELKAYNI